MTIILETTGKTQSATSVHTWVPPCYQICREIKTNCPLSHCSRPSLLNLMGKDHVIQQHGPFRCSLYGVPLIMGSPKHNCNYCRWDLKIFWGAFGKGSQPLRNLLAKGSVPASNKDLWAFAQQVPNITVNWKDQKSKPSWDEHRVGQLASRAVPSGGNWQTDDC